MHTVILAVVILATAPVAVTRPVESSCFRNQTGYSEECVAQAVRYASVAYLSDIASIMAWDCKSCSLAPELEVLRVFQGHGKDNFGYLGVQKREPHGLVLAFRGTSYYSKSSALADLEFTERRWPASVENSAVDHGFLEYYLSVEAGIRAALQAHLSQHPGTPILITGHSLGGAAAVIAAVALHDLIPNPMIYTFGGPRVGNSYFAHYVHSLLPSRVYRVVHDRDIVAHLPPCSWVPWSRTCKGPRSPTHIPTEVLYDDGMEEFRICSSQNGEDPRCCDHFSPVTLSITQHLYYFGFRVGLPDVSRPAALPGNASYSVSIA